MRRRLILLAPLLMGQGAPRGGLPRPRCDFAAAMAALDAAEASARTPLAGLEQARAAGAALGASIAELAARLAGCGCRDLAERAAEAGAAAAPMESAASAGIAARAQEAARFRLALVREGFARQGCR
ncbi:hypothetical protein ACI6QG_05635 [Roseococcus sp. DSY-14]|uniref:hypothetical protein n=1 Tax=Roseococcus sp. DSY-14 TaxID=3369650 RepID=UPI00387B0A91